MCSVCYDVRNCGTLPGMYTLEDLEAARAELKRWEDRWDRYDGGNPDKYRSSIRSAADRVRVIEMNLRAKGVLPPPQSDPPV